MILVNRKSENRLRYENIYVLKRSLLQHCNKFICMTLHFHILDLVASYP